MKNDLSIGCVVMAAGNARRFGNNKLSAKVDDRTLIEHALDTVSGGQFSRVVVITQYDEIESLARRHGFAVIRNRHPDWGISHTISLGTRELENDCNAICYMVSDQPLLRRESISGALDLFRENSDHIVGLAHNGTRGNPCIFPRAFFPELLALREDHGGSTVIRAHEDKLLLYEVDDRELTDVDTPQALRKLIV